MKPLLIIVISVFTVTQSFGATVEARVAVYEKLSFKEYLVDGLVVGAGGVGTALTFHQETIAELVMGKVLVNEFLGRLNVQCNNQFATALVDHDSGDITWFYQEGKKAGDSVFGWITSEVEIKRDGKIYWELHGYYHDAFDHDKGLKKWLPIFLSGVGAATGGVITIQSLPFGPNPVQMIGPSVIGAAGGFALGEAVIMSYHNSNHYIMWDFLWTIVLYCDSNGRLRKFNDSGFLRPTMATMPNGTPGTGLWGGGEREYTFDSKVIVK